MMLSKMLKNCSHFDLLVGAVLIFYIVSGMRVPGVSATTFKSASGFAVGAVLLASIPLLSGVLCPSVMFLYCLSLVILFARHARHERSELDLSLGSEDSKVKLMKKSGNRFEKTLEEEVVSKMVPVVGGAPSGEASYKPTLADGPDHASLT